MSTVELAEDTLLGRRVALKRMHTLDDGRGDSRLRREALIGASLTHPNLVSIFDIVTTEEGDDVIVMEYVEGETFAETLRGGAKPDASTTLRVLAGVSAALDAIHDQGIVHRDVKPANILLGRDGSVKLADLGIAAVADRTRITTAGAVLGTFSYMAPEQLEGAEASPAVDVYALAAVAFEALSGQRARNEPNPVALAHAISTQPPPDLRTAWAEAPPAAVEVLRRAMSRDPQKRPRSAGELTSRVMEALEPAPTAPLRRRPRGAAVAPAAPPANPRSGRGALLAGALVVALIAAVAIILASAGGSNNASTHRHAPSPQASGQKTTGHAAGTSSGSASSPVAAADSPVAGVESFYHLAAGHQYAAAWALADPNFRNQLGGYSSFESGQSGDRSITFSNAEVTNQTGSTATVNVRTTSVRDNGTQHCFGPVNLVRSSSGWLLDHIDINCS